MPPTLIYPTGGEYREALYNTRLCFKDPALIGGTVAMDQLGMPRPISGASASVFTIEGVDGRQWAVKCFTRFVDHQETRYQRISEVLRTVKQPWRVEFEYLPNGVLSLGKWFPALKMEWIDATGLMSFIEKNLWDSVKLSDLATRFARMVQDLSALGIAHGDLQHGNLLVTSSGELKLIDYDGMFVPSLVQLGACEKGHINYQSPARTMNTWGPYLDNFSAWIIYASLVALTIDPTLWTLLHDQGDEALLFNHADFADQHNSRALLALTRSPTHELQDLGNVISQLWTPDMRAIPALDPTAFPAPNKQFGTQGPVLSTSGTTSSHSASRTTPDWVAQSQLDTQAKASGTQTGVSWITGHLAPLPVVAFHPSRTSLRLLFVLTLAVVVTVGVFASVGILPGVLSGAAACAIVLVFIIATILLFRNTSEWRAKHEKLVNFKERKAESSQTARDVSKCERARVDIDGREQKAIEVITKEAEKAKTSERKEIAGLDRSLAAQIKNLEKRKLRLQNNETTESGRALRMYQQQHIASRLSTASIRSAKIPGIGEGIVRSLPAAEYIPRQISRGFSIGQARGADSKSTSYDVTGFPFIQVVSERRKRATWIIGGEAWREWP